MSISSNKTKKSEANQNNQIWFWWPLFPLYPYGRKRTIFKEIVPNQIWSFEQLQGIYYVAVPIRLIVAKIPGGLMLFNPLPPTKELLKDLIELQEKHGPVTDIVLPTASGLEHKISLPSLARSFSKATIWVCPGQWSFPLNLPLSWIGIPRRRTKVLSQDGFPHSDICKWTSLGPIDIGLGRFQEFSCYHKRSKSLLVTDALVGIESKPPDLFDLDPTPILFHSREIGYQTLEDTKEARFRGWKRLVLFASFLKPYKVSIPSVFEVLKNSFKPGLRNFKSHFGIYPFSWEKDWEDSSRDLIGSTKPLVQVAPVLERLVFPRSKETFLDWLSKINQHRDMKRLISSHYSAPVMFSTNDVNQLRKSISKKNWAPNSGDWAFLDWVDKTLVKLGVVPKDPLKSFRD